MRTSQNGINLIKQFEGCRLTAYKCAAGVWTIGYGHIAGVYQGQVITQTQAESFLKDDLMKYEQKVMKYNDKYRWNQNEFDALVSFAYNIGSIDQLTAGGTRSRAVIAEKMLSYCKAAGKTNAGLLKRRQKERELFLTPVSCTGATIQADKTAQNAEQKAEQSHIQLNYQPGRTYKVTASSLIVRTKPKLQNGNVVKGTKLRSLKKGTKVKNLATMRLNDEIWMYIGLDGKGRERWICADTGLKAYIE